MPITLKPDGSYVFDSAREAWEFRQQEVEAGKRSVRQRIESIPDAKTGDNSARNSQDMGKFMAELSKEGKKVVVAIAQSADGLNTIEILEQTKLNGTKLPGVSRHIKAHAANCGFQSGIMSSTKVIVNRKPKTVYKISTEKIRQEIISIAKELGLS